jgi:hypothetical protein
MFINEKNNVNDKFKIVDDVKAERQRKKYERRLDTVEGAINNMYHTRSITDVYGMNLIIKPLNSEELIIAPHETFLKNRLTNIFTNEITTNAIEKINVTPLKEILNKESVQNINDLLLLAKYYENNILNKNYNANLYIKTSVHSD